MAKLNLAAILVLVKRHLDLLLKIVFVGLFLFCFGLFRYLEKTEQKKASQNVATILRNELSMANSYALSKTLVDLENVGVFRCARLTEQDVGRRIFYDSVLNKSCDGLLSNLSAQSYQLKGLNGIGYELYVVPYLNKFAYISEALLYLIILSLGLFLPKYFFKTVRAEQSKNAILALEKKAIEDYARQIGHDVASPLSTVNLMTSLLPGVDPEVRAVLNKALKRTQDLLADLKTRPESSATIPVSSCLDEIIKEKRFNWGTKCQIELVDKMGGIAAIGSESEFKRVVSNLLNNSFEALDSDGKIDVIAEVQNGTIKVAILDNGKGMPPEVLEKVGTKGFSFGKGAHSTAGSGLGVHHALSTLQSWGGALKFSRRTKGMAAELQLVVA